MKVTDLTINNFTVSEIIQLAAGGVLEYEGDVKVLAEWLVREYNNLHPLCQPANDERYESVCDAGLSRHSISKIY